MSRVISFRARQGQNAQSSPDTEAVLAAIVHPALPEPVRLSSDPTSLISEKPYLRGTWSRWEASEPAAYLFVGMVAVLPDVATDAPMAASIAFQLPDPAIAGAMLTASEPGTLHLATVLAATPDTVEEEYRDLAMTAFETDGDMAAVQFSREDGDTEPTPPLRFTVDRFPGLFAR